MFTTNIGVTTLDIAEILRDNIDDLDIGHRRTGRLQFLQ